MSVKVRIDNPYKMLILVGKAGSGKDTIREEIIKRRPDWNKVVAATTRPRRYPEENTYHFLTENDFINQLAKNEMIEATFFNGWGYGTPLSSLKDNTLNIAVMSLDALDIVSLDSRVIFDVIYIHCNDNIRLIRQLSREENPDIKEIFRRYKADEEDFLYLDDYDFLSWDNTKEGMAGKIAEEIINYYTTPLVV